MEEWRDIPSTDGYYQASNLGNIRRTPEKCSIGTPKSKVGKPLRPGLSRGYYLCGTRIKNVWKNLPVHKGVAEAFLGPANGLSVNHIDGNKLNNRIENLEYVTPKQNSQHAKAMGKYLSGENHKMAKLSEEQVLTIHTLRAVGMTYKKIASFYNVNLATVANICTGVSWHHIHQELSNNKELQ